MGYIKRQTTIKLKAAKFNKVLMNVWVVTCFSSHRLFNTFIMSGSV